MFLCLADYIAEGIISSAPVVIRNIAIEAFLLHYRNLRALLCPSLQKTSGDDVIASDFMDKSMPEDVGDPGVLGVDKDRIDKLLAHISYKRACYAASGEKGWMTVEMVRRIREGMKQLSCRLSPEQRTWFNGRIEGEPPP